MNHRIKWLLITLCISLERINCESQNQQWSKPEQSLSRQNNDWIPVEGKCLTCRPNRDLETQSTNEQIGKILSPPHLPGSPPAPSLQQVQFVQNKQPRILPFEPNYSQYNNRFTNDNTKHNQVQSTKLFPQESQKPFNQYDGNPFLKQSFSLPSQVISQQQPVQQQSVPQQKFSFNEPYPFTRPLKTVDSTTPKIIYQPKIRFPDNEPPKLIPNNKITSQNTDEIQLLYIPVETLQRGRKNMKELFNQNQYQPPLSQGFVSPQFNLQYSPIPKQTENQFYFPSSLSQAPYLQLNQLPPQRPDTVYTNISKNFLQPYFTVNGLYNPVSQIAPIPTKHPDLHFYNILQPGLFNPNQIKMPEQLFKSQQASPRQPILAEPAQPGLPLPQGMYIQNTIPTFTDVYSPTTAEMIRSTEFTTQKSIYKTVPTASKYPDFNYQYVTTNPQTSTTHNQQYIAEQNKASPLNQQYFAEQSKISSQKQNLSDFMQFSQESRIPLLKTSSTEEPGSSNYPIPHQPPLSFYMEKLHNPKVNDVLYLLKDAKTIPVLDVIESEPPQVFVGPSELPPPKGYIKFELPYLSSLDYNRIERMIDRLPFFVAPLNFKPPPGYSKIPFPAPHIGSVVLSNTSALQTNLLDNSNEHKYKATTLQQFSPQPGLSTITPQLTSEINSLIDTPFSISSDQTLFKNSVVASEPINFKNYPASSADSITSRNYPTSSSEQVTLRNHPSSLSEAATFKNYPVPTEEITKKPIFKSTYRPSSVSEQPKRYNNRQRKPIYRGYPTSTEITPTHGETTTVTSESSQKYYSERTKNNNNYVEFNTKAKFNINNGNEVLLNTPAPVPENMYQLPITTTVNSQQPSAVQQKHNLDYSSNSQPSTDQQTHNFDFSSFFSNFQNELSQTQSTNKTNAFEPQKPTQNVEFHSTNNQNYPFYSSQFTTNVKLESAINQVNNNDSETTVQPNFNFNNVKPLSQYNPFSKNEDTLVINNTETETTTTQSQLNEFQFWNQNQFYKVNPSTVNYFSSTVDYQTPDASTLIPETKTKPPKTSSTFTSESNFASNHQKEDQKQVSSSSTEITQQTTSSTYRPRIKQRLPPSRYHQFKYTTEKENTDFELQKNIDEQQNTKQLPASIFESSTHSDAISQSDIISLSTVSQELSTKSDIKHRRRRPIRPTQSTSVTEHSTSTSRSYYRTRATRYPTGAGSEKYRTRRPIANSESTETLNSEWSSYSFPSSASTSNDITNLLDNQPRVNTYHENKNDPNVPIYWSESISNQSGQNIDVSSTTETNSEIASEENSTENSPWIPSKQNTIPKEYSIYTPTGQNQKFFTEEVFENKTENAAERKDETYPETKNSIKGAPKITLYEEPSSSIAVTDNNEHPSEEPPSSSEINYDEEVKKEKDDNQKKAHDPQDEKKISGRRRGTWVRRIRIKRPQDVLETAESQNLGRITENTLQNLDAKTLSKAEEKEDFKPITIGTTSIINDTVVSTESITEKEEIKFTTVLPTTIEKDNYANLQNNFAQMLSDFLNSKDQGTKSVNKLERSNVSTENSISYILGLDNNNNRVYVDNSSSSSSISGSLISNSVTTPDEVITITNLPFLNTELPEQSTTTEETSETYIPNSQISTSTTTEISLETEICYRGKCVKTKKSKASDLLPVE